MNQLTNADVFQLMESWAPKKLAYDWDPIGLQIGSYHKKVKKVMVTLDVLDSVADEAIEQNVDLIISHHPLLFKPLSQLDTNTPKGRIVQKLIKHDITVYSAHTNLDIASGGVNDMLCEALNIEPEDFLVSKETGKLYKLAVYVPVTHEEIVRDALGNSGAGHIGNYSHCTFQTQGIGTFKPLEGTNPFIGEKGKMEYVDEVRMETIVEEEYLKDVLEATMEAHPYEEPAYDVFPLKNEGKTYGLGRIGNLKTSMNLKEYSEQIKKTFQLSGLRVVGDLTKEIKRVAVLGGSGEKYIHEAKEHDADVYITGDMTFHPAQDAWEMGLAVIDPGHYIEKVMKKETKKFLDRKLKETNIDVVVSQTNTEPFQFI